MEALGSPSDRCQLLAKAELRTQHPSFEKPTTAASFREPLPSKELGAKNTTRVPH